MNGSDKRREPGGGLSSRGLSRSHVIHGAVCCILACLFCVLVLRPVTVRRQSLSHRARSLENSLREKQQLQEFSGRVLEDALPKCSAGLEDHDMPEVLSNHISGLPELFQHLADSCEVEMISLVPSPSSVNGSGSDMRVHIRVRGASDGFRRYLLKVCSIPSVDRLESVQIEVTEDALELGIIAILSVG